MTTFAIDTDNHITAHATPEQAAAATTTPFDSFSSPQEFAELAQSWPAQRLVAIWNGLPGVSPVRKFQDRKTAASRIWERIQGLGVSVPPPAEPAAKPKGARPRKGGARAAQGAPVKGKASQKATPARKANPATKSAAAPKTNKPASRQQEGRSDGHAASQERRYAGGDRADDGLAAAHGAQVHGGRDEKGRAGLRIFQVRGRGANISHQIASNARPSARPASAAAGFSAGVTD
jgi:hypothetical protein